jgi:16S rRNA (guanine527-N7)-methyltransferase
VPGADDGGRSPDLVHDLLAEARQLGFLGPGPLEPQILHADGFATVACRLSPAAQASIVDLGSGGGLPGLVVAVKWPEAEVTLLEVNGRRAAFLRQAVGRLGLTDRVSVLEERAEVCGRVSALRGHFDGVTARSFGRPAVVAECAAPFLKVGGWLLVSEPPRHDDPAGESGSAAGGRSGDVSGDRWPAGPLRELGLEPSEEIHEGYGYRVLRQAGPCPARFPRRNGVPAKKPLF